MVTVCITGQGTRAGFCTVFSDIFISKHLIIGRFHLTTDSLTPASPEDIALALMHALRFDARRRIHDADELMARLVAVRLVAHLQRCGFVIYTRMPAPPRGHASMQAEQPVIGVDPSSPDEMARNDDALDDLV